MMMTINRMKTLGFSALLMATAWALPASADAPPPDECVNKKQGEACKTLDGKPGVCGNVYNEPYCVPNAEGAGGSSSSGDNDDGGCSVEQIGANGAAEGAALGLILAACALLRRKRG